MNKVEATVEVVWIAFKSLPRSSQNAFLQRILKNRNLRSDLMDMAVIESRRNTHSLRDYLIEASNT